MRLLSNNEISMISGANAVSGADSVLAYSFIGAIVGVGAGLAAMPVGAVVPPMGAMVAGALGGAVTMNCFGNYTFYGAVTGALAGLCSTVGAGAGMDGAMAMAVMAGTVGVNACAAYWG